MMTQCQTCQSELVTEGLVSGQQIRCANCLTVSRFGSVEKIATDRLAWRSFWLGVSSIICLFVTGIPAVYYGIRSLLRMRFKKPKTGDRAAAIIGTSLGGCVGILFGIFFVSGMAIGLIGFFSRQESTDENEVIQRSGRFFEYQLPEVIKPVRSISVLNSQYQFDFADQTDHDQRKVRVCLVYHAASLQLNESIFLNQLRNRVLDVPLGEKIGEIETLKWEVDGEPVNVKKTIYSRKTLETESKTNESVAADSMIETHYYYGRLAKKAGLYGVVVLFETPGCDLTENEVRKIFADVKIIGDPPVID